MAPIIIPINHTREVNCIIEEGVRYCEKQDFSEREVGLIFLGFAFIILWLVFWFWLSIKIEKYGVFPIILGGIVLPLLVLGVTMIF